MENEIEEREKKALKRPQPLRNEESNAIIRIPCTCRKRLPLLFDLPPRCEKTTIEIRLPPLSPCVTFIVAIRYLDRAERWNVTLLYYIL